MYFSTTKSSFKVVFLLWIWWQVSLTRFNKNVATFRQARFVFFFFKRTLWFLAVIRTYYWAICLAVFPLTPWGATVCLYWVQQYPNKVVNNAASCCHIGSLWLQLLMITASVIKPFVLFKGIDRTGIVLIYVIKLEAQIHLAIACWKFHQNYEACMSIIQLIF